MARAEPSASYFGVLVSIAIQISPPCGQGVLNFGGGGVLIGAVWV